MTKVIMDFPKIKDSAFVDKSLQSMADAAKKAQGFLFCSRGEDGDGVQLICCLTALDLAAMVHSIEKAHPEIKMIRMIHDMSERMRR